MGSSLFRLDEGDLLIQPFLRRELADQYRVDMTRLESVLKKFPEFEADRNSDWWRAEIPTNPMVLEETDVDCILQPTFW